MDAIAEELAIMVRYLLDDAGSGNIPPQYVREQAKQLLARYEQARRGQEPK